MFMSLTLTPSHMPTGHAVSAVLSTAEKYMAREARFTVQRFADRLSTRWSKPYSEVMGWLKTRLSFATGVRVKGEVEEWCWHGQWGRSCYEYE